jgi:hypothetical protein
MWLEIQLKSNKINKKTVMSSSSEECDLDPFEINPDFIKFKEKNSQAAGSKEHIKIELFSTNLRGSFVWKHFERLIFKSRKLFDDKVFCALCWNEKSLLFK